MTRSIRPSKFNNIRTRVDGVLFASKREARRYQALKLMERARVITNLVLQTRFPIVVNGVKICTYVADFCYLEKGRVIVEDCKGMRTPIYKLKAKLLLATHAHKIRET